VPGAHGGKLANLPDLCQSTREAGVSNNVHATDAR